MLKVPEAGAPQQQSAGLQGWAWGSGRTPAPWGSKALATQERAPCCGCGSSSGPGWCGTCASEAGCGSQVNSGTSDIAPTPVPPPCPPFVLAELLGTKGLEHGKGAGGARRARVVVEGCPGCSSTPGRSVCPHTSPTSHCCCCCCCGKNVGPPLFPACCCPSEELVLSAGARARAAAAATWVCETQGRACGH
eukprot:1158831-Pelagomonas_calceolata.AAC.12